MYCNKNLNIEWLLKSNYYLRKNTFWNAQLWGILSYFTERKKQNLMKRWSIPHFFGGRGGGVGGGGLVKEMPRRKSLWTPPTILNSVKKVSGRDNHNPSLGEAAKKIPFLVARPLRPTPPPLPIELSDHIFLEIFFRASKKFLFLSVKALPPPHYKWPGH